MATLTGSTIASSYDQLLCLPSGGGDTTTLVALTDGNAANTFCLQLATTSAAFESSTTAKPLVLIKNTTDDQVGAELRFVATQGGTNGVDNDVAGTISFYSNDDGTPTNQKFAQMVCKATDVTSGGEEGSLSFGVAEYDGTVTDGLVLTGQPADGEVDVTIGAGASSTTTIAGNLAVTGTGAGVSSVEMFYRVNREAVAQTGYGSYLTTPSFDDDESVCTSGIAPTGMTSVDKIYLWWLKSQDTSGGLNLYVNWASGYGGVNDAGGAEGHNAATQSGVQLTDADTGTDFTASNLYKAEI